MGMDAGRYLAVAAASVIRHGILIPHVAPVILFVDSFTLLLPLDYLLKHYTLLQPNCYRNELI